MDGRSATDESGVYRDTTKGATGFAGSNFWDLTRDEQSKKRTYSNHLDTEYPLLPGSKSRRTTPSSRGNNFDSAFDDTNDNADSSSVIDLTRDDDDESLWINQRREQKKAQQREEEERYRKKKQLEDEDAWYAQQLQANEDDDDVQVAPHSVFGASSQSGPNAFGRINNRASQIPPSQPHLPNSSFYPSGIQSSGFSSSPSHRGWANGLPLPTHIKSDAIPSSGFRPQSPDDRVHDWLGSSPRAGSSRMPGSFDSDVDSLFEEVSGTPPIQLGDGIQGSTRAAGPRPGALLNGRANPFSNGSASSSQLPTTGNSLGAIINRTNNHDWTTGLDHLGQPLRVGPGDLTQAYGYNDSGQTEAQIRDLLANIATEATAPEEEQASDPAGLKFPLYLHQRMALKWMQGLEDDKNKKGGILADDMGLGKTISTLALMLSRPAQPSAPGRSVVKTNLIVAPVALIKQWEREIRTKITRDHALSVHNAHARRVDYFRLRTYDVVLTSYGKLASEQKAYETYTKKHAEAGTPEDINEVVQKFPFMGRRSIFHRVILDEAQMIKNSKTQGAKGAYAIQAEFRWCLSGTPMMNSVDELASLVHFLQIKPYSDLKKFREAFAVLSKRSGRHTADSAMKKLQALLKAILLRRTKTSTINGQPIITLPRKIETVDHVIFRDDEEKYYRDLERDSQVTVSSFLRQGTIGRKYQAVLVLLLRLRQACCHPFLHITDLEFLNVEAPADKMKEVALSLKPDAVKRIKEADGFECPICYDGVENPCILACGHSSCHECLVKLIANAEEQNRQAGSEGSKAPCPECRDLVELKDVVTYEIFKLVHMPAILQVEPGHNGTTDDDDDDETDSADSDSDDTASEPSDDEVNSLGNLKNFIIEDDDIDDDNIDEDLRQALPKLKSEKSRGLEKKPKKHKKHAKSSKESSKSKKGKGKGKEKGKEDEVQPHELVRLRKEASNNKAARIRYLSYLRKEWIDSAKVTKCMALIAEIQATGEKTIVFSQWTLLLELLEAKMGEGEVDFRRFDGGMSSSQRDNAVSDFMEIPNVTVMLVSLKAGNAGLNLTAASHIIIMDPFWNPFVENQAVDRAHRIGQQRDVKVHRILVQGTVEDRIVELQNRKRDLVNSALDENAQTQIARLGANELAYLFGVRGR
ncbi:SNF2 family N-terminal domain-containing protein [Xylariales sp. AK1849]|nr:SNF2 family N-terminal domain-containing protein [Xylariales sp. AK1849]